MNNVGLKDLGVDSPKLIIFDFDGTLAETEELIARILSAKLAARGIDLSAPEISLAVSGRPDEDNGTFVEDLVGFDLHRTIMEEVRMNVRESVAAGLSATPGALGMLKMLQVPFCIASNASRLDLVQRMKAAGLFDLIGPRFFSSQDVGVRKPDPAVFLLAAEAMGVAPSNCLVVEDSVVGLVAARRAHMRCCAYTGGRHHSKELCARLTDYQPDAIISNLAELDQLSYSHVTPA